MARIRKVTRTILSTEAEVMTVNTATQEFGSVVVPVGGEYTDTEDKALVKAVKKGFESLNLADTVMLKITALNTVTRRYSMLESQFMALAEYEVVDGEELVGDEE